MSKGTKKLFLYATGPEYRVWADMRTIDQVRKFVEKELKTADLTSATFEKFRMEQVDDQQYTFVSWGEHCPNTDFDYCENENSLVVTLDSIIRYDSNELARIVHES
jgi:hypothetical protein